MITALTKLTVCNPADKQHANDSHARACICAEIRRHTRKRPYTLMHVEYSVICTLGTNAACVRVCHVLFQSHLSLSHSVTPLEIYTSLLTHLMHTHTLAHKNTSVFPVSFFSPPLKNENPAGIEAGRWG